MTSPWRMIPLVLAAWALLMPGEGRALAEPRIKKDEPVYLQADKMGYDARSGLVLALGRVEVYQGEYILLADRITYDQKENLVRADGEVTLLEPGGTVYFAESLELRDDLKAGVVKQFRIRMADNSLFAAREATRVSPEVTDLAKAVYSPCKICEKNGVAQPPLWQIKADKVRIDEKEQDITYRNAFMEVYGVPVLYTPYLSHPTPGADRKSGILLPEYTQSGTLGTVAKAPVYLNLAPDKDATLTPWVTSEEGVVMEGQYRQLTDAGDFQFDGSATYPRDRDAAGLATGGQQLRGHIFARAKSALAEDWGWGFDVNRASDDTYLRRYGFGNQETLTSRLYTEYLDDRDYLELQGLAFQGLEVGDDPDAIPLILPSLDAHAESRPLWHGSRLHADTRSYVLTRETGAESRRASFAGGWRIPHVTKGGHVWEADMTVRADAYSLDHVPVPGGEFGGTETRAVPQATLAWRYPMIKQVGSASVTAEPIVQVVASSNGNNPGTIPNEDSQTPEFSDLTLFYADRFPGADVIENGSRLMYGMRGRWDFGPGKNLSGMVGQNVQLAGDPVFPLTSGYLSDYSDVVGRVGVDYDPIQLSYRFNVDHDDAKLRRNEIHAGLSLGRVSLFSDYVDLNDLPYLGDREEILAGGSLRLDDNWTLTAAGQRDLALDKAITAAGGLIYADECLTVFSGVTREFTRDRDIEPNTSFSLRVGLKNLE